MCPPLNLCNSTVYSVQYKSLFAEAWKENYSKENTLCKKIVEHFIELTVLQHLNTELNFPCVFKNLRPQMNQT